MKKTLPSLFVALLCLIWLAGCGPKEAPQGDAKNPSPREMSKRADEAGARGR